MSEERPLKGYKMLDLSRYLPGPYCSMMLADMGMEVLRVEEPIKGDPARWIGPVCKKDSIYFLAVNRNKRSIGINLSMDEGKMIFRRLCGTYDVVLENFRPGTMDALGLGYSALCMVNPALVLCSISGFGQQGPRAQKPGHDLNYLALSGFLGLITKHGSVPTIPPVLMADLASGLLACIGILTALLETKATGKGRHIDVSMMDSIISLLCYNVTAFGMGQSAGGKTDFCGDLPCYNIYETKDHHFITVAAMEPQFWRHLCMLIGHPEWADKQWAVNGEREQILSELKVVFAEKTEAEWKECFAGREVCCEPVRSLQDVFSDLQVAERQMVLELYHQEEGRLYQSGNPIKFSGMEEAYTAPPRLGQHTLEVLKDLGYTQEEIASLKEKAVI